MLRSFPFSSARAMAAALAGPTPRISWNRSPLARVDTRRSVYEALESRRLLSVNVSTYHYNNAETGANTNETALTLSNVNANSFGKIASMAVSGQIYGQPLVMTGVPMGNGQGTHDIVLVTTETDLVYAFDAYGNNPAQGYLWKISLLQSGESLITVADVNTNDITPTMGITGTPVINQATNIMYLVGSFKEANGTFQQRLYALNISDGTNAVSPVIITASVSGSTLNNSTYSNPGGVVSFNAQLENQRPALTLANGEVYIGWSSHGDNNPWHGWVIGYNATTLHQDLVYCNTTDGEQGGIWMSGGGIAVDASGNLYFTTGNGTFDANTNSTANADYGMTLEEVSPSLAPVSYFAPYNQASLSNADLDYGCSNVILLTGQGGSYPNEILSAGKWGTIYLNNLASLGGYNSNGTGPNNDLGEATLNGANTSTSNVHNTLVYWNGSVYLGGDALTLQAFSVANGVLGTSPSSKTSHVFGSAGAEDGQGAGLTVSSNGSTNGIVWALDNSGFLQSPAVLYAYNASNLSQVLWTSSSVANSRDTAGIGIKFQDPVVANGHVYIAGDSSVTVYGLLNASSNAPTVVTPAAANPTTLTSNTTTLSVLGSDPAGDLSPNYTWSATTVPSGAAAPTFSINDTNNANNCTATFSAAGTYTLTATIEDPNSGLTTTSSINVTVVPTLTSMTLSPSSATVADGASQQFTATGYDQYGNPLVTQPTFTWGVNSGGIGGTISTAGLYTAPTTGTGFDTITVSTGAFNAATTVAVGISPATYQVNLSTADNKVGIVADGTTLPNGGIDGDGDAISANLVGTSQTWNSVNFAIPAPTNGNTTPNVISGAGQTITLPQNKYATLRIMALHVNGNQASSTADQMVLTYVGGTTQNLNQKYSDWFTPQGYTGESSVVTMAYRDSSGGGEGSGPFYIYGYSFAITNTKQVQSIKMPTDSNFVIVAMDLVGLTVTTPAAANPSPITATTTSLSATGTSPGSDASPTYTWYTTNEPTGATAPTFSTNGTTTSNVSIATFHKAGAYTFTVVITDPTTGLSGTSSVNVTVNQTLTQIIVSPTGPVSLVNGQTAQFSANGIDQFGQTMSPQPAITWNVSSGIGSVSSAGLYQAPSSGIGNAVVQATSGAVQGQSTVHVTLPAWLGSGSTAVWDSSTHILTVTGAASIVADPGSDQPIVMANSSSAVLTVNPTSDLLIHLAGLSLTNGATATVTSLGSARSATNHRLLVLGTTGAVSAPLLIVDSTSKLNLTDNDLVDHTGNVAAITQLVQSGFSAGVSSWNGSGIASTAAVSNPLFALGVSPAAAAGTFDGETVTTADVEVRFTYFGDATLDGRVDSSDYSRIDNGFLNHLTGFNNGDFNYDQIVNGSDYTLIDNAFNTQSAPLATQLAVAVSGATRPVFATSVYPISTAENAVDPHKKPSQERLFLDSIEPE